MTMWRLINYDHDLSVPPIVYYSYMCILLFGSVYTSAYLHMVVMIGVVFVRKPPNVDGIVVTSLKWFAFIQRAYLHFSGTQNQILRSFS